MTTAQYQLLPDLTADEFAALKADIAARGVQVPVEYDEAGNVLDGHHRLRACEELGLKDWPSLTRVGFSEDEKREHVLALNLARRHLTREQRVELEERLRLEGWSYRRIAEKVGVDEGTVRNDTRSIAEDSAMPSHVQTSDGRSYPARRPSVAAGTEADRQKAQAALNTLPAEALREGWQGTREVASASRKYEREQQPPAPALPDGVFSVVYADPPWEYANSGLHGAAAEHYPTLPTTALCDLPLVERLAENAVCFLWVTNPLLVDGLAVLGSWGFAYKTNFVWVKDRETYGKLGFYCYGQHELLLLGVKGSFLPAEEGKVSSLLQYPKREHSRKPEEVYALIETMYPGAAYVELFARTQRQGWTAWGSEVGKW
jgi:N6-adenosine-specific RNA methylase IME4